MRRISLSNMADSAWDRHSQGDGLPGDLREIVEHGLGDLGEHRPRSAATSGRRDDRADANSTAPADPLDEPVSPERGQQA